MGDLLSCEFNIDTGCMEPHYADDSRISIDRTAVVNEVADNMYQYFELDWLIYNALLEHERLILNGNPEKYLKALTGRLIILSLVGKFLWVFFIRLRGYLYCKVSFAVLTKFA